MSIKIMQEVWEAAPVDQGTLLVLLALADSADERTRTCFPGIDALAIRSRLSERQVQYCLQRLRELKIVSVKRNASPVKTNLYRIEEAHAWAGARDAIIAPHGSGADTQSATSRDEVDCVSDTQLVAPKPSVTSEEPSDTRARARGDAKREIREALLTALPETLAEAWIEHRRQLKKPMTPQAARLIAAKLKDCSDPAAVVNQSIMNGWQGVFPERQSAKASPRSAVDDASWWWGGRDLS